jgi:hypothetical protein
VIEAAVAAVTAPRGGVAGNVPLMVEIADGAYLTVEVRQPPRTSLAPRDRVCVSQKEDARQPSLALHRSERGLDPHVASVSPSRGLRGP